MPANYLGATGAVDMTGLLTSTFQHLEKKGAYFDAISKATPLIDKISKNGNAKSVTGERAQVNLMYGLNSTFGSHKPYSTLPVDPQDGLGAAFFPWAEYHVAVSIDGKTLRMNAGPEKVADLVDTKYKQSLITVATNIDKHLWDIEGATLTALAELAPRNDAVTGGAQIIPVPFIVIADADANYLFGGLNSLTYSWWRPLVVDFGTVNSWALFKAKWMRLYTDCQAEGLGDPDIAVCDKYTYLNYFNATEAQRRYESQEKPAIGASAVKFMGMDVFFDQYICDCDQSSSPTGAGYNYDSGSFATGSVYMLNSKMLGWRTLKGADWAWQGFRKPVDQDAQANLCIFNGQIVPMNRRCHGLLHGLPITDITS